MLPMTHNNCKHVPSIVDGDSGINIISKKLYDAWDLPKMEYAPFPIKLANQRKVAPLGLVKNASMREVGIQFLVAFVVMELPSQSSLFFILLGRPWLKAVVVMHDWKNDTLLLQSLDGEVKVNLKDWRVGPMILRGSKPSSSTSTATHTSDDTQMSSNLS